MVDISKIDNRDVLDSNIRKQLLLLLYDDSEKSPYSISKFDKINLSVSTVIEHLQKLEKEGFVERKEASKGNLRRYLYKITKKGKNALHEYYNKTFDEFRQYIALDETTTLFNTFTVLEAAFLADTSDPNEISNRTGLSIKLVKTILWNLEKNHILIDLPPVKIGGKKRIKINIEKDALGKILQHFRNGANEIKEAKRIFIENQIKIAETKVKTEPFKIKN